MMSSVGRPGSYVAIWLLFVNGNVEECFAMLDITDR